MSDHVRHPPAVTLSAQNLAFAPHGFAVGNSGNIPIYNHHQIPQQMVGQPIPAGAPSNVDLERQAQKMREYEQQRSRLQHVNAKGSTANPDAMIAQMLGKPLASSGHMHRPANSGFPYPHGVQAPTYAAVPRTSIPMPDIRQSTTMAPPVGPMFYSHDPGSVRPPSALHLTPRDLENMMMQHFAGMRMENGKFQTSIPNDRRFVDSTNQEKKPSTMMDGVFVIPTLPSMVSPDGLHYTNARIGPQAYFMPPWTREKAKLPEEYLNYLNACLPPNRPFGVDIPDTGLVYVLLRTSGLSNEILGTIWALTNRSQPGQLTKEEFFAALALVALAQETGAVASVEMLSTIVRPPIPRLSLSALNISGVQVPSGPVPPVASMPATIPSMNSTSGRRLSSAGVIESTAPTPTIPVSVQPPSFVAQSSTVSNDDFGEFTDFQAAVIPESAATVSKPTPAMTDILNSTAYEDRYNALRSLAEPSPSKSMVDNHVSSEKENILIPSTVPMKHVGPIMNAQDDGFGDFTNATQPTLTNTFSMDRIGIRIGEDELSAAPISNLASTAMTRSRTEPKMPAFVVDVQKKDLNELMRQTLESLDLGTGGGSSAKSDDDTTSVRSESKEPSIHSLDLHSIKQFDYDQQDLGDGHETHVTRSPAGSISLVDKYGPLRRENGEQNGDANTAEKHVDAWTKCLEACLQLLKQAEGTFAKAETEDVRREILSTDRGSKYLCGNVQIYRVSRRIRLSLQTTAFQTDTLVNLIQNIDMTWANLCNYVSFSGLLPTRDNLDFRHAVVHFRSTVEQPQKPSCCGVCLLDVDATCKTVQGTNFDYKLTYGGRQYHAQCANLWINCIDSVLPALEIPSLL